eukprot:9934999-Alexandrium_andersonii.AAC.1
MSASTHRTRGACAGTNARAPTARGALRRHTGTHCAGSALGAAAPAQARVPTCILGAGLECAVLDMRRHRSNALAQALHDARARTRNRSAGA